MEKYADNLEVLVQERTEQLQDEKKKTDALLERMLPRRVLSPGQTELPTRAKVTKSKPASAGGQTVPPSRVSLQETFQLSEYDRVSHNYNKITW